MQKKRLTISTISLVRSPKMTNGASFRLNETNPEEAMWLPIGWMKNLYTNQGLSPETSFQMLRGSTISYWELEVTEEMLAANGGKYEITNPETNTAFTVTTKGIKQFGHTLRNMSDNLEKAIFGSGVKFDSSWAEIGNTTRTANTTANGPVVAKQVENQQVENQNPPAEDKVPEEVPEADPVDLGEDLPQ